MRPRWVGLPGVVGGVVIFCAVFAKRATNPYWHDIESIPLPPSVAPVRLALTPILWAAALCYRRRRCFFSRPCRSWRWRCGLSFAFVMSACEHRATCTAFAPLKTSSRTSTAWGSGKGGRPGRALGIGTRLCCSMGAAVATTRGRGACVAGRHQPVWLCRLLLCANVRCCCCCVVLWRVWCVLLSAGACIVCDVRCYRLGFFYIVHCGGEPWDNVASPRFGCPHCMTRGKLELNRAPSGLLASHTKQG